MLTAPINYKDPFTDEEKVEVCYFHLSKSELIELELGGEGGSLAQQLKSVPDKDPAQIVELFKRIIGQAYGIKDGARFVKSKELSDEFLTGPIYDALFFELMTVPGKAIEFVKAVVPKEILTADGEIPDADAIMPKAGEPTEEKLPWADREPTQKELANMSPQQLRDVYLRKTQQLAQ